MSAALPDNPYPGLRAFEPHECELFFGRERETEELRHRLRSARFVAVIGGSGSGKSSLVRSGLIPALHRTALAGTTWRVAISRPGEDPIGRLARALDSAEVLGAAETHADTRRTVLEVTLRDSSLGLAEAVRHAALPPGHNVLVVVDQFEELLRFRRSRQPQAGDDAAAFVKLLLGAARCPDLPIYVVLTMRAEFTGECMAFHDLPEAINAGQYLIPRMSRDALSMAITGPAAARGATIAPRLLVRLLNEVGDDPDRLPVLQHALMRTWDAWARDHQAGEPLDERHYQAVGTMKEALSRHADQAYAELASERERAIAQRLFKTLTETTEDGRGVRRPTAASRLTEVCGCAIAELEQVIDRFRAQGRAFLQPAVGAKLAPRDIVDISHESLMRLWTRLARWVEEEARAVEIFRRLARSADEYAAGRASLWRPPELSIGLRWLRETRPSAAWASVDRAKFDQTLRFLQRSRTVYWSRLGGAVAGVIAAVGVIIGYFAITAAEERRQKIELERQVADLNQRSDAAAVARGAALTRALALSERHGELNAAVSALQQARDGLVPQLTALRKAHRSLQDEIDRLEGEIASIQGTVTTLREGNRSLREDLANLAVRKTQLAERRYALDQESDYLDRMAGEGKAVATQLEHAPPALESQLAELRKDVDTLGGRRSRLLRLVDETKPCPRGETAAMKPPPPEEAPKLAVEVPEEVAPAPAPVDQAPEALLEAPLKPRPETRVEDHAQERLRLRARIADLSHQLDLLLEEKARLQDRGAWLEQANRLLEEQRAALEQEYALLEAERSSLRQAIERLATDQALRQAEKLRLEQERRSLEQTQRTLRDQIAGSEAQRKALATQLGASEERNRRKRADVEAAQRAYAALAGRIDALASEIGAARRRADSLRADNQRLAGIMSGHVDRLLQHARSATVPSDAAALLALKAWRWAPYDTDDPSQPAVYNALWQALSRVDEPAARRLLEPGDDAVGKLATTTSQALAEALCRRVTRPISRTEWLTFMPEKACFTDETARPCPR